MKQLVNCAFLVVVISAIGFTARAETRHDLESAKKKKQELSKRQKSESAEADERKAKAEKDELKHLEELESVKTEIARIEADINDIIRECKLPPEADAALHGIIVPLLGQAQALKAEPTKLETIPPMRAAY